MLHCKVFLEMTIKTTFHAVSIYCGAGTIVTFVIFTATSAANINLSFSVLCHCFSVNFIKAGTCALSIVELV